MGDFELQTQGEEGNVMRGPAAALCEQMGLWFPVERVGFRVSLAEFAGAGS